MSRFIDHPKAAITVVILAVAMAFVWTSAFAGQSSDLVELIRAAEHQRRDIDFTPADAGTHLPDLQTVAMA